MQKKRVTPLISIIMTVFNKEKFLVEAIDSILRQSYPNFEFIIIDDCSNDQTPDILSMYANQEKRVKVIVNKKNIGTYKSANLGLAIAKGKYIARMDADDISYSNRFEKQVQFLESNPEIGLLGSAVEIIDENGYIINKFTPALDDHLIRWKLLFNNSFAHSSWMLRKNTLNKVGGRYNDLPVAQDYSLASEIIKVSRVANLPDFLIKWRISNNQISETRKKEQDLIASYISLNNIKDLMGFDFINYNEAEILRSILKFNESINKKNYSVFTNFFRIYNRFKNNNGFTKHEINDISKLVIMKSFTCINKKVSFIIKLKIIYRCFIINPIICIYYFFYKLFMSK